MLTFQGTSIADINWGLITGIEVREALTGTFVATGRIESPHLSMRALARPGDPSATMIPYAVKYTVRFDMLQTSASAEIALLDAATLFGTDVEVRVAYASGRKITLGAVTGYPLRLVAGWESGDDGKAQIIQVEGTNIEPLTSFPGKVA
jgi:choline dehydrogenase-like flavoprotein